MKYSNTLGVYFSQLFNQYSNPIRIIKYMEPLESKIDDLREYLLKEGKLAYFRSQGNSLRDLQTLEVGQMNVAEARIIRDQCQHLKKLDISQQCQENTLRTLSECFALDDLTVKVGLDALNTLNYFPRLRRLVFQDSKQYDNLIFQSLESQSKPQKKKDYFFELMMHFPGLESLGKLEHISSERLVALKGLVHLKELDFMIQPMSTQILSNLLTELPHLTSLGLHNCGIENTHLDVIRQHVRELKSLDIGYSMVQNTGLNQLEIYKEMLNTLFLNYSPNIQMKHVVSLLKNFKGLTQLRVEGCKQSDDLHDLPMYLPALESFFISGLASSFNITKFIMNVSPTLKELSITNISSSEKDLKIDTVTQLILQKAPDLRVLKLQVLLKHLTSNGCCYLSKLKQLRYIQLNNNSIGESGFIKILRNLSHSNIKIHKNNWISGKTERNAKLLFMNGQMIVRTRSPWL